MAITTDKTNQQMGSELLPIIADAPVFMFSGQGSQKPKMGEDLMGITEVASVFECASDVFGFDVAQLISSADAQTLNETRNAQRTLCTLSVGIAEALRARGVNPAAVLGFSLGQISALAVSGMLSVEETFALVKERSRIMAEAAEEHPGVMSALLKIDEARAAALCEENSYNDIVVPANFNCPGQIVVSGTEEAVKRVEQAWINEGGRVARLATAGAFHSPLMADAAQNFATYLENIAFNEARIPLICNVDAAPLTSQDAREHLALHLVRPVLFDQSVRNLIDAGAKTFAEVGYGGVLYGLMRRIDPNVNRINVQDRACFDDIIAKYGSV